MKRTKRAYTFFHKASAIFMIAALAWLTVSVAFVTPLGNLAKKDKTTHSQSSDSSANEEESSSNNTTEEKVPSGSSLSEEYLHHHQETHYFFSIVSTVHKCENADTYIAFHGELLVPPPNRA